jgi:hypothetical protein
MEKRHQHKLKKKKNQFMIGMQIINARHPLAVIKQRDISCTNMSDHNTQKNPYFRTILI